MTFGTILGLTGSIGAGKSSVATILEREHGAIVIDADTIARTVVAPGTPTLKKIIERFGSAFLLNDQTLDRKKLGSHVFTDAKARADLESIVHPAVREHASKLLSQAQVEHPDRPIVYMVPLLFEAGSPYPEIGSTIAVLAPRDLCISRIVARDGCTEELANRKFDAQLPPEQKRMRATYVIDNDGTLDQLRERVRAVMTSVSQT
jgi:dephospho-CoA kinase